MPSMIIRTAEQVPALALRLAARKMPMTVSWTQGVSRTAAQNRLIHRWFQDVANQLGDETATGVKRYCKLHFGVPILRTEDDAFREFYDTIMKHRTYEEKIAAIDFIEVTSRMKVQQLTQMMDVMQAHYLPQCIRLTDPEALRYESEFA